MFRPVGNVFHQISKLQQLAPLSTAACSSDCPQPRPPRAPVGQGKTPQRPTLKLHRTVASRKGRPGTALGRPGTALGRPGTALGRPGTAFRRQPGPDVAVTPCFEEVPPSTDVQTALNDTVAQAYFAACSSKAPLKCVTLPLSGRMSDACGTHFMTHVRHYSMEKEFKTLVRRNAKPCFAPKRLKDKPKPIDWRSPCACNFSKTINRCAKAKCAPSVVPCRKPRNMWKPFRCPKKPKVIRMKKRKPGRKVLLGYKLCKRPPQPKVFACHPKPPPIIPDPPTPKRCPMCTPNQYYGGPPCKKIRGARQPVNCKSQRRPPECVICPPRK